MTLRIGALVIIAVIALIAWATTIRAERHPLLIDASAKVYAAPNLLLMPCPLAPQNVPPLPKESDA